MKGLFIFGVALAGLLLAAEARIRVPVPHPSPSGAACHGDGCGPHAVTLPASSPVPSRAPVPAPAAASLQPVSAFAPSSASLLGTTYSPSSRCAATLVVDPQLVFPVILIFPPPRFAAARAYFAIPTASTPDLVFNSSQDRLWIAGTTAEGACRGFSVTRLVPNATSRTLGVVVSSTRGPAEAGAYETCMRTIVYQNTAAHPCPPSGWDTAAKSPSSPPEACSASSTSLAAYRPGTRDVIIELCSAVGCAGQAVLGPGFGRNVTALPAVPEVTTADNCPKAQPSTLPASASRRPRPSVAATSHASPSRVPPAPSSTPVAAPPPGRRSTTYSPSSRCNATVIVNPQVLFPEPRIFPPPQYPSARAYFAPATAGSGLVFQADQDRLWVESGTSSAGGPCASFTISRLFRLPSSSSPAVIGVLVSSSTGTQEGHVYQDCMSRIVYQNIAAHPCPASGWDLAANRSSCGIQAHELPAYVPGTRQVVMELCQNASCAGQPFRSAGSGYNVTAIARVSPLSNVVVQADNCPVPVPSPAPAASASASSMPPVSGPAPSPASASAAPTSSPLPSLPPVPVPSVTTYSPASEFCSATVIVDADIAFPVPAIFPPPLFRSARAYFAPAAAGDSTGIVFNASQDRLWIADNTNVLATGPCAGYSIARITPSAANPTLGIVVTANDTNGVEAQFLGACISTVTYQNTAAFPCPPSVWDTNSSALFKCVSPIPPEQQAGYQPGTRGVLYDLCTAAGCRGQELRKDPSRNVTVLPLTPEVIDADNCPVEFPEPDVSPAPSALPSPVGAPPSPAASATPFPSLPPVPVFPVTTYSPDSEFCGATVIADPEVVFAIPFIFPPPLYRSARAYFATSGSGLVFNASQDRLWIEGNTNVLTSGPCAGLMIDRVTPTRATPTLGIIVTSNVSAGIEAQFLEACMRAVTYQNTAAFPCPPSVWDTNSSAFFNCVSPIPASLQAGFQPGTRGVIFDLCSDASCAGQEFRRQPDHNISVLPLKPAVINADNCFAPPPAATPSAVASAAPPVPSPSRRPAASHSASVAPLPSSSHAPTASHSAAPATSASATRSAFPSPSPSPSPWSSGPGGRLPGVVVYSPNYANCSATVVVDPEVQLVFSNAFPPARYPSARAYFSVPNPTTGIAAPPPPFSPPRTDVIFLPDQDRLWFIANETDANSTIVDPCPGFTIQRIRPSITTGAGTNATANVTSLGVIVTSTSGPIPSFGYDGCLSRLTYQNIAAYPCPPSVFDTGRPNVFLCARMFNQSGYVPGERQVIFEVCSTAGCAEAIEAGGNKFFRDVRALPLSPPRSDAANCPK